MSTSQTSSPEASMAPSLRKMMGKRSMKSQPTPADDSDSQRSSSETPTPPPPPKSPARATSTDLSSIPLPPEHKLTATSRKVSPSKTLLERYMSRSGATRSTPDISIVPPESPADDRSLSPRTTAFSKNFETRDLSTSSFDDAARRVARVRGIDFEMLGIAQSDMRKEKEKSKSDENIPRSSEVSPRCASRSQSRKQERADSHQYQDQIATKDFALLPPLPLDVTPALNIRKTDTKEARRTPSPLSAAEDGLAPPLSTVHPRHVLKAEVSLTPSPKTLPELPNLSPPQQVKTIPNPTRPKSSSPLISRCKNAVSRSTSPDIDAITTKIEYDTVHVRPPVYDLSKTPGQQWESDLGSTSRPHRAWEWTKRWTCCQCEAQTIVEQIVCSQLACGHDRCPDVCRIIKSQRVQVPLIPR